MCAGLLPPEAAHQRLRRGSGTYRWRVSIPYARVWIATNRCVNMRCDKRTAGRSTTCRSANCKAIGKGYHTRMNASAKPERTRLSAEDWEDAALRLIADQ